MYGRARARAATLAESFATPSSSETAKQTKNGLAAAIYTEFGMSHFLMTRFCELYTCHKLQQRFTETVLTSVGTHKAHNHDAHRRRRARTGKDGLLLLRLSASSAPTPFHRSTHRGNEERCGFYCVPTSTSFGSSIRVAYSSYPCLPKRTPKRAARPSQN